MTERAKMSLVSPDPNAERAALLRELFPDAVTEGKIDVERLRQALGENVATDRERYELSWAGKSEARRILQSPSMGTLAPDRAASVNFDATENMIIEGDNLEVLKLLQKDYTGRVKMIYIDPPYNTGNEFIYPDNFREGLQDYLRYSGQVKGDKMQSTDTERSGQIHSKWLSMMYPRLFLAKNLLADEGFIAVSIGNEEVANLRLLMNELYGEENHRNTIAVRRYDKNLSRQFIERGLVSLAVGFEYVLIYSRNPDAGTNPVFREASQERQTTGYWKGFWNAPNRPTMRYPLLGFTPEDGQWKWQESVALQAVDNYEQYEHKHSKGKTLEEYWDATGRTLRFVRRNKEGRGKNQGVEHWIPPSTGILRTSNWTDQLASEASDVLFDNPKHTTLLTTLIRMLSDEGDIVLDFFGGSSSTGEAVLELNKQLNDMRKYIIVQLPERTPEVSPARQAGYEHVAEIGRERMRKYFSKRSILDGQRLPNPDETPPDLGFKAFRLTASNFKIWDGDQAAQTPDALAAQLQAFASNLHDDAEPESVLFEILLKCGLPDIDLCAKRETLTIAGQTVTCIADGALVICLEPDITRETILGIVALKPQSVVCLDSAFGGDDALLTNAELQMRDNDIQFQTV